MLQWLFRRPRAEREAKPAYAAVVAQARRPEFYAALGVPDSVDGRFDMIVLHVFLVMNRLRGQGEAADAFVRALLEEMFADMDASLREMGVGDLSVPKRIKEMLSGYYGRAEAYGAGLAAADDRLLSVALDNNLYGTVPSVPDHVAAMAVYVRREAAALATRSVAEIIEGGVTFGAPPVG